MFRTPYISTDYLDIEKQKVNIKTDI